MNRNHFPPGNELFHAFRKKSISFRNSAFLRTE